jgi:hypothetical protein
MVLIFIYRLLNNMVEKDKFSTYINNIIMNIITRISKQFNNQ